jgi:hypothetical protein
VADLVCPLDPDARRHDAKPFDTPAHDFDGAIERRAIDLRHHGRMGPVDQSHRGWMHLGLVRIIRTTARQRQADKNKAAHIP